MITLSFPRHPSLGIGPLPLLPSKGGLVKTCPHRLVVDSSHVGPSRLIQVFVTSFGVIISIHIYIYTCYSNVIYIVTSK